MDYPQGQDCARQDVPEAVNEARTAGMATGNAPMLTPVKREVRINAVENGFIVTIGCKTFIGMDWEVISKQLGEYFADPIAAEKKYCKK